MGFLRIFYFLLGVGRGVVLALRLGSQQCEITVKFRCRIAACEVEMVVKSAVKSAVKTCVKIA